MSASSGPRRTAAARRCAAQSSCHRASRSFCGRAPWCTGEVCDVKSDAKTRVRNVTIAVSLVLAVALGGCGGSDVRSERGSVTVGVLLPAAGPTSRTGQFDKPLIEKKLKELCPDCRVQSTNAKDDATVQQQQIDS